MSTRKKSPTNFWHRHRHIKHILIGLVIITVVIVCWFVAITIRSTRYQSQLQPFYDTTGLTLNNNFGEVVKQEPLNVDINGGTAYRILYRTQRADGSNTFSSGMVFIPNGTSATPRPVVAWAHGTVGMGDSCAPSRTNDPANNINWVNEMMQQGWVVTATDYSGLGTAGTQGYLVGDDEAHDVLNSVRAVKNIPQANAGNNFTIWGHSQGGHSALFTAQRAATYAPELQLLGTVASAPAAELVPLLNEQSGSAIDWVIGPEALVAWPTIYSNLNVDDITTSAAKRNYKSIAQQCISQSALEGIIRTKFDQSFFSQNLVNVPSWRAAAQAQSAPSLLPNQPLMVVESLSDQVVLPNTTALYIQNSCAANSNLTQLWVNNVGHIQIPQVTSPQVIAWLNDRFSGANSISNCSQPLPITPAVIPPL